MIREIVFLSSLIVPRRARYVMERSGFTSDSLSFCPSEMTLRSSGKQKETHVKLRTTHGNI